MPENKKIVLEPAAQKFADDNAKPPFLPDLGPEKGRETVDTVQSGEIKNRRPISRISLFPADPKVRFRSELFVRLTLLLHHFLLSYTFTGPAGYSATAILMTGSFVNWRPARMRPLFSRNTACLRKPSILQRLRKFIRCWNGSLSMDLNMVLTGAD